MSFTFRPLALPADAEVLRGLLALAFPELAGAPDLGDAHLEWKFGRSARAGRSLLGFDGERPVAFYGVLPQRYAIDGTERELGLVVDVLSHPEVRRRGLFVATGRAALDALAPTQTEAVIGFPIRDDVMPGHRKVGWEEDFRLPVHVLPVGTPAGGDLRLRALGAGAAAFRALSAPLRSGGAHAQVRWLDPDAFAADPGVAGLCARGPATRGIVRSPDYWRWRLARPGVEYRCAVAELDGRRGYAVVRATELREVPAVAVLDMAAEPGPVRDALLSALVALARAERAVLLACCANPAHAAELGLARRGFVRTPLAFRLIHRWTPDRAPVDWFADETRWRMSWLDADTV